MKKQKWGKLLSISTAILAGLTFGAMNVHADKSGITIQSSVAAKSLQTVSLLDSNTQNGQTTTPTTSTQTGHYSNGEGMDFDWQLDPDGTLTILKGSIGNSHTGFGKIANALSTSDLIDDVKSIEIDKGVTGNTVMDGTFGSLPNLTKVDAHNLDTSSTVMMDFLFISDHNLTDINVSNWNTSKVQEFDYAFAVLDIPNGGLKANITGLDTWDLQSAVDLSGMFEDYQGPDEATATQLINQAITKWDVHQVAGYTAMFMNANISYLDLSNWHMSGKDGILTGEAAFNYSNVPYNVDGLLSGKTWKVKLGPNTIFTNDYNQPASLVDSKDTTTVPNPLPIKAGVTSTPLNQLMDNNDGSSETTDQNDVQWIGIGDGTALNPTGDLLMNATSPIQQWGATTGFNYGSNDNSAVKQMVDNWNAHKSDIKAALLAHDTDKLEQLFKAYGAIFNSFTDNPTLSTYQVSYNLGNEIINSYEKYLVTNNQNNFDNAKLYNQTETFVIAHANVYQPALTLKNCTLSVGKKFNPADGFDHYTDELGQSLNFKQAQAIGLTVDTSKIDVNKPGTYPVTFQISGVSKAIAVTVKAAGSGNGGSSSNSGSTVTTPTTTNPITTTPTTTTPANTIPSTSNKQNDTVVTPNYAAVKGSAVYATKRIYLYRKANFKKSQRIATYPEQKRVNRPMFVVTNYARSNGGALRYRVKDVNHHSKTAGKTGYITANNKYVVRVYYQSVPKNKKITVIAKKGIHAYKNESLTGRTKTYKKGTGLTVKKLVKHNLTTRYQLSNGYYVTANKKLVIQGNY